MTNTDDPLVYIVDDESAIRAALSAVLEAHGFRTEQFGTPSEFLAACDLSHCCCLIVDVRLPEMSGFELLDRLPRDQLQVPVFMITGHGDAHTMAAAERRGVVLCLQKPFNSSDLVSSIKRVLTK